MPTNQTAAWKELQSFGQCEPSPLAFRALAALLDTWPDDDQAAAFEYAKQLLNNWPDPCRLAPWSWCKAASRGATQRSWTLARALQLESGHLSKGNVDLVRLAHYVTLEHITELELPFYSDSQELSLVYHRPETFPCLKRFRAGDKFNDGDVRALEDSPLWRTLERFEIEPLSDSLWHCKDASRIVPQLGPSSPLRHVTLRSPDLIALWDADHPPQLTSAAVFIRSIDEAQRLASREELSALSALSIAFRCGSCGLSPFEPFLGNIIEADEAAANTFFADARLDRLDELTLIGYPMGYWGREGLGWAGLEALIASGLLHRLTRLHLQLLPLGDQGVTMLASALGPKLETLELQNVYCLDHGAAALTDSRCLPSLKRLDLSGNRIGATQAARLAAVAMPQLRELDLSGPPINPYYSAVGQQPVLDEGAAAWSGSDNARRLKKLRLSNCFLSDDGLNAVFQSAQLKSLEVLDLSHSCFTATGVIDAVTTSPLWRTLREVALNNCHLDNDAIAALTNVNEAPALRALELGYNSIGPRGAGALANWPVLAQVWRLDLHDNIIGDEGLIALARSDHLGLLLELDFEQDCWNSRTFTFNDHAAAALAGSSSLPRLDCMFSGCVDEYHGTAYSPGFTPEGLEAIRHHQFFRAPMRAACSDFKGISEYIQSGPFNEQAKLQEQDFRGHPPELNTAEATGEPGMQQISSPTIIETTLDPPTIRPTAPEPTLLESDVIEGVAFRDAVPVTERSLMLGLSLEDESRPLPNQVGKVLTDTLGPVMKALALGYFDAGGAGSYVDEDGRTIHSDITFYVGVTADPEPASQLIREALWWIGAPANTDSEDLRLSLAAPKTPATRLLQLAAPKVVRWGSGDDEYRIDRIPFSAAQRAAVGGMIQAEGGEAADQQGWTKVATGDGGTVSFYTNYLDVAEEFDTLSVLVDELTPAVSGLIYRLMAAGPFLLWPMVLAVDVEVAGTIDCAWPQAKVVSSVESLHGVLSRGPYVWWRTQA